MRSILITIVFDDKSFHVIDGDFPLIFSIKNPGVRCNISRSWMEFFIHGSVEIHQHFTCSDCFKSTIIILVIDLKYLPEFNKLITSPIFYTFIW